MTLDEKTYQSSLKLSGLITQSGGIYQVSGSAAKLVAPKSKTATSLTIASSVSSNGKKYKVTAIGAGACKGMKKLKTLVIPEEIKIIGPEAFRNCSSLKKVTIKTIKLTEKNVGDASFAGIHPKVTFTCPAKKLTAYKKILLKKGAPKTAKFTK